MIFEEQNIDGLFRDNLQGYKIEPGSNLWSKIEYILDSDPVGRYNHSNFEGLRINPSQGLWQKIAKKLWLYNFWKFTPNQINIYYALTSVIAISGIAIYFSFLPELNNKAQIVGNQIGTEMPGLIIPEFLQPENERISEPQDEKQILKSTVRENNINKPADISAITQKISISSISSHDFSIKPADEAILVKKIFETFSINDNIDFESVIAENSQYLTEDETSFTETNIIPDIESINAKTIENIIEAVNINISGREDVSTNSEFPDTVGKDYKGRPIVIETTHLSINFFVSPCYTTSLLNAKSPEFNSYTELRKKAEENKLTFPGGAGALFNMTYKNILLRSGVNYAGYGERFKHNERKIKVNYAYDYYQTGYNDYDTIWITNIDSLLEGSTYQVPYIRTTWVPTIDSQLVIKYDTVVSFINKHNIYSYIELPVEIGYELNHGKFTGSLCAGMVTGILLKANGTTLSEYNYEQSVDLYNNLSFNRFVFSAIASAGITYKIGWNTSLFAEVYFKRGINSIYKDDYPLQQRHINTGCRFGVRYTFDKAERFDRFVSRLKK
ncbi:MAG: PorT family protein [Bacteroidia bacterium]|nr:PorT family protein [Bacteroidia bacterium]